MQRRWPDTLMVVRHGQSAGNVAREAAESAGRHDIAIDVRDVDVPLSPLGERQATALGQWIGRLESWDRPTVALTSPYARARATTGLALSAARLGEGAVELVVDERLRERELGVFDRLTSRGIRAKYPEHSQNWKLLGKFYHRPPGGESWCDVILRLRSFVESLASDYPSERVLVVCHQAVVLCMRCVLEHMTEEEILAIDRAYNVANCSVTAYEYDPAVSRRGGMRLTTFNFVAPLEVEGAPVTEEPDAPVGAK